MAEKQVIEACYAAKRISQLSATELISKSKEILLRIHVVTGWTIPANEILLILVDEFQKKLVQDYGDMNEEEIMLAFRKYGTTLKDWGKDMNLNLIETVITEYLNLRYRANMQLENMVISSEHKELPPIKMTDSEIIEGSFDYWKTSSTKKPEYISPTCFDILHKNGKLNISSEDRERIKKAAIVKIEFYDMHASEVKKCISDEIYVENLCKKIAVAEYFNLLISENKEVEL